MKFITAILIILASVVVFKTTDQYLFCPFYNFAPPKIFTGNLIYNPYVSAKPDNWIKCNFHAHAFCWNGITNGKGTAKYINQVYDSLHYGVHAVSNYQNIDTCFSKSPGYISSYEHGFNIKKNHQLVLGANKICWKDYLFPQTINNKQNILNCLSADTNRVIIINHPLLRNGYTPNDLRYLTNYRCMEVLNPSCISASLWDAALSAGKPVFIMGNDDVHNIYDSDEVGRMCTWINVAVTNKKNILSALKTGDSYGMIVGKDAALEERRSKNIALPALNSFNINGNTIKVKFNMPAKQIQIFGREGKVLQAVSYKDSIVYTLGVNEPYARVVAVYDNGTQLFLNPAFRYTEQPLSQTYPTVNINKTLLCRIAGILVLLVWVGIIIRIIALKTTPKKAFSNII